MGYTLLLLHCSVGIHIKIVGRKQNGGVSIEIAYGVTNCAIELYICQIAVGTLLCPFSFLSFHLLYSCARYQLEVSNVVFDLALPGVPCEICGDTIHRI